MPFPGSQIVSTPSFILDQWFKNKCWQSDRVTFKFIILEKSIICKLDNTNKNKFVSACLYSLEYTPLNLVIRCYVAREALELVANGW